MRKFGKLVEKDKGTKYTKDRRCIQSTTREIKGKDRLEWRCYRLKGEIPGNLSIAEPRTGIDGRRDTFMPTAEIRRKKRPLGLAGGFTVAQGEVRNRGFKVRAIGRIRDGEGNGVRQF